MTETPVPLPEQIPLTEPPQNADMSAEPGPTPNVPSNKPKSMVGRVIAVLMALFIILLIATAAGLGYWDYTLNNNIKTTQAQIQKLQKEYDTLKTSDDQLNKDNAQAISDLAKANDKIKSLASSTTAANNYSATLQDSINKKLLYLDILNEWFFGNSISSMEYKVANANDTVLTAKFAAVKKTRSNADWDALLSYLVTMIQK